MKKKKSLVLNYLQFVQWSSLEGFGRPERLLGSTEAELSQPHCGVSGVDNVSALSNARISSEPVCCFSVHPLPSLPRFCMLRF